jgi:flagellar hook-associated protein 1 FlgK
VASSLHGTHDTLASLFSTGREQLDAITTEVNNAAKQVAQLNQAVVRANQAELPVNELADQRDKLVLHIAELTGATAVARVDGSVDVFLGGSSMVNGPNVRTLAASGAGRLDDVATSPVAVQWADNGAPAGVPSGQLASTLQTLGKTLPDFANSLDQVAANFASAVNTQHKLGFDKSGTAGVDFYSGTTAATIAVAITDPNLVAAASSAASGGGGTLDGSNADALAAIGTAAAGPDRLYRQVVVDLGVAAQTANRRAGIQDTITQDIDAARTAQSGVNLDEEMTNLVSYQRAYQAATKVISTINEMLTDVLNLVGR